MLHQRLGSIVTGAVVAGASFAAFANPVSVNPAFAATPGIACKALSGNTHSTATVTFTKCTGNTGKASKPLPGSILSGGGTITWKNNKTTTVTLTMTAGGDPSKCPAGWTPYNVTGRTTADTTGSAKVGGKVKAKVCVNPAGAVVLATGTKATIQ